MRTDIAVLFNMMLGGILAAALFLNKDVSRETLVHIVRNGDAVCAQFGGLKMLDFGGDYECVRNQVDEK